MIMTLLVSLFSVAMAQQPPPPNPNVNPAQATGAPSVDPDLFSEAGEDGTIATQFIYDPTSGRDPFKIPKGVHIEREAKKAISAESNDPLQRINLDTMQILGIIWETKNPRAMIRDEATKAVFTITKNMHLGPNQGIVTDIREGSIVVLETFTNDDGDDVKVPRIIPIRK